jgi:hypothetical protein
VSVTENKAQISPKLSVFGNAKQTIFQYNYNFLLSIIKQLIVVDAGSNNYIEVVIQIQPKYMPDCIVTDKFTKENGILFK